MPELKRNFTKGRMNKDLDERMVPNGEYRDALNVEVATSEGSDVGTVQTLKGNTALTDLFSPTASCVGTITDEKNNKIYWLVADPHRNYDASWETGDYSLNDTFVQAEQDDATAFVNVVHKVYSDYIMEYDETKSVTSYVAVEHWKIKTVITNDSHGDGDHLHISDLGYPNDIRHVGIQVGMTVLVNGILTSIKKIEADNTGNWNGWRVYTEQTATDIPALADVTAGDSVVFELPKDKRALGFYNFATQKPGKLITGINIIDDLLFWTDGLTEPKKINIKRCIYGSQQLNPTYQPTTGSFPYLNGTRAFPTLLVVNGESPSHANGRLGDIAVYPSAIIYPFLSYKQTTVIKKSPIDPLILTMSNTTKPDKQPIDGLVIVDTEVTVPTGFFFDSSGDRFSNGQTIPTSLTFNPAMDWEVGNTLEWFAEDDDAGFQDEPIAVLIVESASPDNTTFTFTIQSISPILIKPYKDFRVRLQQDDPLFEFKFPRFAYRWKYEDGEYSCYSPFSEVAFLPDEFDYLPKKGYNLGMTNNLRYLVLSGFKPTTMPLDVVEVDILYKESNSPNVYTVDTIKAPSKRVDYLGTDSYSVNSANAWFGKIMNGGAPQEIPNTLNTSSQLVGVSALTGGNTGDFYTLEDRFSDINLKVGDTIELGNAGNIGVGTLVVSGMQNTNITVGSQTQTVSQISITVGGVAVTGSAGTWLTAGNTTTFSRNIAQKPAVYVTDPKGSLQVKTDMIYATVPSNQLLRPYDNVPKSALAQEITGNRVVYGNYVQNYNLTDANNELTKVSFTTKIHTRSNIRSSVRYDDRTALIHPTNGTTIDWWDALNAVKKEVAKPERSLKSLRDYQVGVVYVDEFGRQTPIQTHDNAVKRIPKSYANEYNSLRIQLDPNESTFPDWATHFKFYIKENANEYYNLAMDRFYSAEDGNIWLSFPSSERNKVDEETFLILKKQHDNDTFVSEEARYKILAISNEAPLFVKTKMDSFGIAPSSTSNFPKIGGQFVDVSGGLFTNTGFSAAIQSPFGERVVRISDSTNKSRWYDIVSITTAGSSKRITVSKPFGVDVAFTTDDNTNTGNYVGGVSIELAKKEVKNLPEFSGRFFVKIHKDGTFTKNITSKSADRLFVTVDTMTLGYADYGGNDPKELKRFWTGEFSLIAISLNTAYDGIPGNKWFVDGLPSQGTHPNHHQAGQSSSWHNGAGLLNSSGSISPSWSWTNTSESKSSLDISYHSLMPGDALWTIPGQPASAPILLNRSKMKTTGSLFRFKGDTTIYKVTGSRELSIENYDGKDGTFDSYTAPSNHRVKIRMEFTPKLGSDNTVFDAVGKECTGYDPFYDGIPGTNVTNVWNKNYANGKHIAGYLRQIEFVEEFAADESYTSDNPAIWETEPKENVDVDLYNEASAALPIGKEFDTYKNEFYTVARETSYNALNYYNCFSFNNGVESNRIRDDYNTVTIDKGPKVSTVLAEQYKEEHRKSGLIYSGIFNSTSGVNNLNQFIQAEKITKDINPTYGSIQKLYSKDTNLVTFCEDRIIGVLANKDALFNADGNSNVTATSNVLGAATPYAGDYGMSTHPESFAVDQYRMYFTDKSRGVVLRLSQNGLTPISDLGMRDHFKDVLRATNINLLGSYDENKKLYNLTMRAATSNAATAVTQTVLAGTGTDYIDFADANIIGYIPFDGGGNPGTEGDGTGPFAIGTSPPYAYGVIGNTSTTFNNLNGNPVQAFGQYNINNNPSAGGSGGGYGPNVTQIHLPVMDWYSAAIASRMNALIDALNNCPNGDVYLHAQIQAGGDQGRGEMPGAYINTGAPIVTFKVNSINFTGTRYELDLTYFSGLHGGNIDSYYFWYSTSGCDVDSVLNSSNDTSDLGYTEITASFSEDSKGWSSFKSWLQQTGVSINDKYFTFSSGELYQHHDNETRNNFYGVQYTSTLCVLFNDMPSSVKSFSSLSYEGSQSKIDINLTDEEYYNNAVQAGWFAESIVTDLETGQIPEFREKEGKWFNFIRGNKVNNLANLDVNQFSTQGIGRLSAISVTVSEPAALNKLTVQDVGDID